MGPLIYICGSGSRIVPERRRVETPSIMHHIVIMMHPQMIRRGGSLTYGLEASLGELKVVMRTVNILRKLTKWMIRKSYIYHLYNDNDKE